ncbi:MAG TPA: putative sulfate exporter family transporter [Trebonia sp.]|jgi:uncharacterized integral membrane protein (TIGR00698 family)|nr:putative sulfate exporter family transporter [Trebonia sp.]
MNAVTHPRAAALRSTPAARPSAAAPVTPAARANSTSAAPSRSLPGQARAVLPGLALAVAVAAVATVVGQHVPLVGSAVPGAVIGAVIALAIKPGARLAPGIKVASTFLLQCSVVLLGTQLSIAEAARVGVASLPVMLGTLAVCLSAAWLYGRLLGIPRDLRTLIGVGTGICGGSAIAAVSPVIEAASTDVAYAISTIFLFNIAAVLVFPLIGHAIGMSQQSFGLFAGTAVNDTSSVVATATTYGPAAANHAVVVKLVRTLMIIPICLGLAGLTARRKQADAGVSATGAVASASPPPQSARLSPLRALRLVPWFLIGFVVAAGLNSAGVIPSGSHGSLQHVSVFLVAVALSAIGLSTNVPALRTAGPKPVLLGALLWITVAVASLGLQTLTGALR